MTYALQSHQRSLQSENGEDTRLNLYELDNHYTDEALIKRFQDTAKAVGCLIRKSHFQFQIDRQDLTLNKYLEKKNKMPLKEGEKFANEPYGNTEGTAFLISENTALTVAHVVCNEDQSGKGTGITIENIKDYYLVFNFRMADAVRSQPIQSHDVYEIKKVKDSRYHKENPYNDWALIKLTRKVEGIVPLKLDFSPVNLGDRVYMLGYPEGLTIKLCDYHHEVKKTDQPYLFQADVGSFGGNSGSPIPSRITHKVRGILGGGMDINRDGTKGEPDYEKIIDKRGQKVLIRHRHTKKQMAKYGYDDCIRISTIDIDQKTAWLGRNLRKELSNKQAWNTLNQHGSIATACAFQCVQGNLVMVIGLVTQAYLGVKLYADWAQSSKINPLEYKVAHELTNSTFSNKEKYKVARNMVAYAISDEQQAYHLHQLEVDTFKRRFSPEKILGLLNYEKEIGIELTTKEKKSILSYMQKEDRHHDKNRYSSTEETTQDIAYFRAEIYLKKIKKSYQIKHGIELTDACEKTAWEFIVQHPKYLLDDLRNGWQLA